MSTASPDPVRAPARRAVRVPKWLAGMQVALYRLTGGRIGGRVGRGRALLLTTIGRRTGRPRTVPLNYFEEGRECFIVASNGGSDRTPAWYLNLVADPRVEIQIGGVRRTVAATTVDAAERARLWPLLVARAPLYAGYQRRTTREIPLVLLRDVR